MVHLSRIAAISLGALAVSTAQGNAEYEPDYNASDASQLIAEHGFRETGKTKRCITFTDMTSLKQIGYGEFLFTVGDKHYLNRTQSACSYREGQETRIAIKLESGYVCRNTIMYVTRSIEHGWRRGRCTLSMFRELEPIPQD
ncbi:hypothetical protein [Hyphococcus sp.]|uniref:hypothetical protein n=1 Tax=Hyphococcus sp. TaxID=2038636 RepID=UPI0020853849|nr:MAG: hypothetical protein DHS20C04_28750 [Marinicaulis sp.]